MGDVRFLPHYERVQQALDDSLDLSGIDEHDLVSALAGTSRSSDAYLANVLATELMNRTRRLRTITDALGEGVIGTDPHGRVRFINPAACELLGREAARTRGMPALKLLGTDAASASLAIALAEAYAWRGECVLVHASGRAFPVRASVEPVLDGGDPVGCVVAFEDVSDRVAARHEREELLRAEREARRGAEAAERRALFLADATRMLATSPLGGKSMTHDLLKSVVPGLAEWAAFHRLQEGTLVLDELAHADPERLPRVWATATALVPPRSAHLYRALEEGKPLRVGREALREWAQAEPDQSLAQLIEEMKLATVLITPVQTGERLFGALTVASSVDEAFDDEDVSLVAQISRIAAVGLQNADLYEAERRLHNRYEALLQGTSHMLFVAGEDGAPTEPSPSWEAYTGQTYEQMLGGGWAKPIHPEDRPRLLATYADVRRKREPFEMEVRIQRSDGVYEWFRTNAVPILDAEGNVVEYFGSLTNVQAEHDVPLALQESELRFRSMADTVAVPMWQSDADGHCQWFNRSWLDYTGRSLKETIRTGYGPDVHPDDLDEAARLYDRAREAREPFRIEYRLRRHDGAYRWMLDSGQPMFREAEFVGYLGSLTDVTEHREKEGRIRAFTDELERRVRERTSELARTNAELEAFTQSVSHDLRAPLRGVDFFAEILQEDYAATMPQDARDMLDKLRREATRASRLVTDLLNLSRANREPVTPSEMDVSSAAWQVVRGLERADPRRTVDVDIADDITLHVDPMLFRIVLENLIGNAWKFTSKTPRPSIGLRLEGNDLVVEDNGAGFDSGQADRLFRPFERLHAATEYDGTGLGLATVARIIERHGGSIRAEGAPNAGATFRVKLPQRPA